ncbi:aldo/keto reductase [Salibacterium halotolerans]|uniref:Predicted oxidoreductase n=1 Tax=Salibacterium halotolerans TaxID=1884432 RepID=A0A1I5PAU8_9BACI|nr:aldo/keto reductase [Salibacterium halotolerans]SFP31093.1 Predicted oxidoreductase [Salibacterium halotolerans]
MAQTPLTKENIPSIALGTWSWGTGSNSGEDIFGNHLTEEDLRPVFDKAVDAGFTLWDTAAVYGMGNAETILGRFMQGRRDLFLSTKFTPGMSVEPVEKALDTTLERLDIDHTDIYWIHNPTDVDRWTKELIPLMKNGKIKHAGVSNHNLEEVKQAASILEAEGLRLSAVQNHYSLLYRSSEDAGIIDWCRDNDVVFFSYMVLEQGALSGKFDANNPMQPGTRRGDAFNAEVMGQLDDLLQLLKKKAETHNVKTAEIAMAWAIAKGTVPIVGVTKPHHVDGAASAAGVTLSDQEISELEETAAASGVDIKGGWEKRMD